LEILKKLAEKHDDWVSVARSFGLDKMSAEDLTQDMYIKMHNWIERNGKKYKHLIYQNDQINYFLVYRALNSIFIDMCRKESKITKVNIEYLEKFVEEEDRKEYKDIEKKMKQLDTLVDKLYWYDAKVFRLLTEENMSIAELSKKSGISYYSLYNTYKNVKSLIKQEIQWD